MKTLLASVIAFASILILLAAGSPSGAAYQRPSSPRSPSPSRGAPTQPETFDVIKIGDDFKVIRHSELAGLKKSTADDYKKDMKAYQDAKKELAKSKDKDKSAMPTKPVKHTPQLLKGSLKTQEDADAWLAKHLEEKKDAPKSPKTASN